MTKTISMKKLYQWASEYPEWKRLNGYNWENKEFEKRLAVFLDFFRMIWEKRNK